MLRVWNIQRASLAVVRARMEQICRFGTCETCAQGRCQCRLLCSAAGAPPTTVQAMKARMRKCCSCSHLQHLLVRAQVPLAVFFGRRGVNDALLPLLITCLNAGEWLLRSAFFRAVADIGGAAGAESLDVFLLPCLEQVSCVVSFLECRCPFLQACLLWAGHTQRHTTQHLRQSLALDKPVGCAHSSAASHLDASIIPPFTQPHSQALTDSETSVVGDAVRCIAHVAHHLRKRSLLSAAQKVRQGQGRGARSQGQSMWGPPCPARAVCDPCLVGAGEHGARPQQQHRGSRLMSGFGVVGLPFAHSLAVCSVMSCSPPSASLTLCPCWVRPGPEAGARVIAAFVGTCPSATLAPAPGCWA